MWTGQNGILEPGEGLIVVQGGCSVVGIVDNIIEGIAGPEIKLLGVAGKPIQNVNITGNQIINNQDVVDQAHPVIEATGPATAYIADVVIAGNIIRGQGSAKRFKWLINYSGALSGTSRWVVTGNSCFCVQFPITGSAAAPSKPDMSGNAFFDGAASSNTENDGEAVFVGDGVKLTFDINTSLIAAPRSFSVTPSSPRPGR
jgi:hypothetical protein